MADRFPLIANSSANQIQEIPSGDQLNLSGNNIANAGIITATSFHGSGANLTALNASNISSGTVPTARLGSGTASSSKFLRGDSTFQNISTLFVNLNHGQNFLDDQNLIFGDASDMILIHQSSGAKSRLRNTNDSGSLDIESTLTRFLNKDGSTEKLRIDSSGRLLAGTTDIGYNQFADNLTLADSANCGITLRSGTSNQGNIYFSDGTGTGADTYRGYITYAHADNIMLFATNSVERVRIKSDGKMGVNTNNPQEMLHVNGTTQSTDYKYTSHPGHTVFTGDNSTTSFTIQSGHSVNSILVVYNGAVLTPTTDYTVSGTTLSMNGFTPPTNAHICVRYLVK